ncbi:hypothetical protein AN1V17_08920 [Vallitalea sediminicola]
MAFDPNLFIVDVAPDPANIVIGREGIVTITASNNNPSDWGYNYTLQMTIPDGVSFVNSDIPVTSQVINIDNTITLTWLNIKDLAPNETDYEFAIVLMADENYRETGLPVPFNTVLTPVAIEATVDTKPRGDGEPGNIQYAKSDSTSVKSSQYAVTKIAPNKIPKGAGIPSGDSPQWPFEYEFVIENNTRIVSSVSILDVLDNGIRFIGPITAVGPDSVQLIPPNPIVINPTPGGQDNVTIEWTNVDLSVNSINIVKFDVAIWNNYTVGGIENSGDRIPHQTPMNNMVTLTGTSGPVSSEVSTLAMDITINKSQSPIELLIGSIIDYTIVYRVNQYDNVDDVLVTDIISDGQTFQSATPTPTSVSPKDPITGETTVTWDFGTLVISTSGTITFSTVVDTNYFATSEHVLAGDTLTNMVDINGENANFGTQTPDSSDSFGVIQLPSIDKQLLDYYYKDGTLKSSTINAMAPGDFVEFQITYNAPLNPPQADVIIDDFFPLVIDASTITSIVYNPFDPISGPLPTGIEGVEWLLDNSIPGMTIWTVVFRVQMKNTDFIGSENNLAKLKLMNSDNMIFSDRDQVLVNFGEPNINLDKSVVGPSPNAILPGQIYTYTIIVSNPQNIDGTIVDAFDVSLSDIIPDLLTYVPLSLSAIASGGTPSFNVPVFTSPDQINMEILQLKPDDEITLTYQVTVDAGIGPGISLTNDAETTSPYSQPFDPVGTNYQYPNLERSDSETLVSADSAVEKTVDNNVTVIGDTVNYTITWTVPEGLQAYDVRIVDILPNGQSYDNDPSPVPPESVVGQTIRWPTIPVVDATAGAVTLIYSFRASIDSSASVAPDYTEVQRNRGRVIWNSTPTGFPMRETDFQNVRVENPHVSIEKGERNISRGETNFVTSTNAVGGEIVEFRISIVNDGSADAYNIEITDTTGGLSTGLIFIPSSIVAPAGTTATYQLLTNQVLWNIPYLPEGDSLELLFRVRIAKGLIPGSIINNDGIVDSYSNINMMFMYPTERSNQVEIIIEPGIRGDSLEELLCLDDIKIQKYKNID